MNKKITVVLLSIMTFALFASAVIGSVLGCNYALFLLIPSVITGIILSKLIIKTKNYNKKLLDLNQ